MACQVEGFVAPIQSYSGDQFEHRVFCSACFEHIGTSEVKGEQWEVVLKAAADQVLIAMRY